MRRYLFLVLVLAVYRPALAQQTPQEGSGLTAYRPLYRNGYLPFERTPVPENFEEHRGLGPGIRVNGTGEIDPQREDDLIEVVVTRPNAGATFVLKRSDSRLSVWETRRKQTEIAFTDTRSGRLAFRGAQQITLWVEWTGSAPAYPTLSLLTLESDDVVDRLVFHAFQGLVVALGGEGHEPDPLDMNEGMYRVAKALYERGWDVLMRNEDDVYANGYGPVYDEVKNAIRNRSVRELAIFGFSRGGGSTYDLCVLLDSRRHHIGTFSVNFTAYVDAIRNFGASLFAESRRPPASGFHANYYQRRGPCFRLIFEVCLRGRPMDAPIPPRGGLDLDVGTRDWGEGADHLSIDDLDEVHELIRANLTARVSR